MADQKTHDSTSANKSQTGQAGSSASTTTPPTTSHRRRRAGTGPVWMRASRGNADRADVPPSAAWPERAGPRRASCDGAIASPSSARAPWGCVQSHANLAQQEDSTRGVRALGRRRQKGSIVHDAQQPVKSDRRTRRATAHLSATPGQSARCLLPDVPRSSSGGISGEYPDGPPRQPQTGRVAVQEFWAITRSEMTEHANEDDERYGNAE